MLSINTVTMPAFAEAYPSEAIVWEFNSTEEISKANAAVATATCGSISADTSFVNSYAVSATFTTNATRRMQVKLPNNVIQQKNSDGDYIYNYLHILIGNPQNTSVTFGCGINTTSANTQVTLPANSWTVASFYIEDLFLAGNSNYKRDGKNYADSVQGVAFQMSDQIAGANTTNAGIKYNLDKIWVTTAPIPEFKISTVSPENGADGVSLVNTELVYEFSRMLKPTSPQIVADAFSDGTHCVNATMRVYDNKVSFVADEILNADTSYSFNPQNAVIKDIFGVKLPNITSVNIKTSSNDVQFSNLRVENSMGDVIHSIPSSGEFTLCADAVNYSGASSSALISATVVNKSSGISSVYVASDACLSPYSSSAEPLPALNLTVPKGHKVFASIIDSAGSLMPLSNTYLEIDTDTMKSTLVYANANITGSEAAILNDPNLVVDKLTISGNVGTADSLCIVSVRKKEDGTLKYIMPVKAYGTTFSCEYTFDAADSGVFEVSASVNGIAISPVKEVVYLSAYTKEQIRAQYDNSAMTQADSLSVVKTYRNGLGISSHYSSSLISHIANTLLEQKPYASYPVLVEMLALSVEALGEINSAGWDAYDDVFEIYSIILNGDLSLTKYNSYDNDEKSEIHKIAIHSAPFSDFVSLRKVLVSATLQYEKNLEAQKEQQEQQKEQEKNSVSQAPVSSVPTVTIGSQSGSSFKQDSLKPVANTPTGNANFSDVSESHWAYEAINELTKRNIISGYTDGSFMGERAVSRAEFVKMLTGCFNFPEGKGAKFNDVSEDMWFASYLSRASGVGIVKGNSGMFMPDNPITRQDAALMLHRALTYKNISLSGSKSFSDISDISDYALHSVNQLGAAGLISGYEDGSFAPLNEISRYETAKLLNNALIFLNGGGSR